MSSKNIKLYLVVAALAVMGTSHAATVFNSSPGSDVRDGANWSSGLPGSGNDGTIANDGTMTSVSETDTWMEDATVDINSGATIDAANDWSLFGGTLNVNNGTITAVNDIFARNGILNLFADSTASADDFAATGFGDAGTLNIYGGTHTATSRFGVFDSATLNFQGGSVTADEFLFLSTTSIGGSATASATSTSTGNIDNSVVDVLSSWTGTLTSSNFSGTNWETVVVGNWTLDGATVDSTTFANEFEVTGGGTTLALIPEPSSLALLGIAGLLAVVMGRRRRA